MNSGCGRGHASPRVQGRALLSSFQWLLVILGVSWLSVASLQSLPPSSHGYVPSVCPNFLPIRTDVIGLELESPNPVGFYFSKDTVSKGYIHQIWVEEDPIQPSTVSLSLLCLHGCWIEGIYIFLNHYIFEQIKECLWFFVFFLGGGDSASVKTPPDFC